jgi:PAS domain S-box-containing protein
MRLHVFTRQACMDKLSLIPYGPSSMFVTYVYNRGDLHGSHEAKQQQAYEGDRRYQCYWRRGLTMHAQPATSYAVDWALSAMASTASDVAVQERLAILTLDSRGMIRDCNLVAERLFGYAREELAWQYISCLLPQLVPEELMRQGVANPRLRFLCHIGRRFHAVARDGAMFTIELCFNVLGDTANPRIVLIVRPV